MSLNTDLPADLMIRTRAESPALARAAGVVEAAAWLSLGFLNFTRAHYAWYDRLLEDYADYQLCLVDRPSGYVVACANCVPFHYDADDDALPDAGWDWIVETAHRTRNYAPNRLGGLAVSVPSVHRAGGLARLLIAAMKDLAAERGLAGPLIPVRPSRKAEHPFVGIDEYLQWTDEKGRPFDPWLRSHLACGGRIAGVARRSMTVEEPIGFWEAWTGQRFEETGSHAIAGGLVPLEIDKARGVGRYAEPNVWFSYN